jgi:hypothetical protein
VGDTSTAFAAIIGTFINQRYKDVLRRSNWQVIDDDYAITATSAAAKYALPSNFGKELYVYNSGTTEDVPYLSFENLEQIYHDTLSSLGTVDFYTILDMPDSTAASATRTKYIKFYKQPNADTYFTIPYSLAPADLSASTDELVLDCELAVEYGATADAWAYKRQFAKSQYYEALYEKAILTLMWDKANQPNQLHQMNVQALNRDEGI